VHIYTLHQWKHSHQFHVVDGQGERNTRWVVLLTVFMMVVEIVSGMVFGSMALLADGWHMGTHAMALGITVFAYGYARRHAGDPAFSFGTGKVGVLGGYTSAVLLGGVALFMAFESIQRLIVPVKIQFTEAIGVASAGLAVNVFSAWLLRDRHVHAHDHDEEKNHHHDHNLYAAYLHVMADALTSLLAIFALVGARTFGWIWMDPIMGIVGAVLILRWSIGLLRATGSILLDGGVGRETVEKIKKTVESDSDNRVCDIHVWPLGSGRLAAIISIVTHYPRTADHYKTLLSGFDRLNHITVEINEAEGESCLARQTPSDRQVVKNCEQ
jgi:cation diffusion facilitator family transporter